MMPLTADIPKPLLKVGGKTLLDHTIGLLPDDISEIIIVVDYLKDQIVDHVRKNYPLKKFVFLHQKECDGTGAAVMLAEPYLRNDKFIVLFSDDLHSKKAVAELARCDLALLVKEAEHPERFGVVGVKNGNYVKNIVEKPEKPETNLVNAGIHVLDDRIFNYKPQKHSNGEYYLTDMIHDMAQDYLVRAVKTDFWMPLGYPDDLKNAEKILPPL